MTNAAPVTSIDLATVRADRAARRVVRGWRRLTGADAGGGAGSARTLVGCSGGADSVAMLLALAGESDNLIAAYVRHPMRSRAETDADAAFVRALAARLGVPFVEAEVEPGQGNVEASSRRARYAALTGLAERHACPFVAVAHHGDDLLETQVMALLRGTSPRGLASMRPRRRLSDHITLIRPMLGGGGGVTREDTRRLCARAGVTPIEDRTNTDTARVRAALRVGGLAGLTPRAARRAHKTAALMREAQALIEERAAALRPKNGAWDRSALRGERSVVVSEALRREFGRLTGNRGLDALGRRALGPVIRAIRDGSAERRVFALAMGVRVILEGEIVRMEQPR